MTTDSKTGSGGQGVACVCFLMFTKTMGYHKIHFLMTEKFSLSHNHVVSSKIDAAFISEKDLRASSYHTIIPNELAMLQVVRKIGSLQLFSIADFIRDPFRIFLLMERLSIWNPGVATRLAIYYNLFGGSLLRNGNAIQQKAFLKKIDSLGTLGCFALTELGYGNSAAEMKTVATYDKISDSFVINTNDSYAQKFYIAGIQDADVILVFARLVIDNRDEGIHSFVVPLYKDNKKASLLNLQSLYPGVHVEQIGPPPSLISEAYWRIWFDKVTVPRESLLNRLSDLHEINGKTVCISAPEFPSTRSRFTAMTQQLMSGRLCMACIALASIKRVVSLAVHYSHTRMIVGSERKLSLPIIQLQLVQHALTPMIARIFALNFALSFTQSCWVFANPPEKFLGKDISPDGWLKSLGYDSNRDDTGKSIPIENPADYHSTLESLCCTIKPMLTWFARDAVSLCRERCGAQGHLGLNGIMQVDSFVQGLITAEGDNAILLQKAVQERLEMLKHDREMSSMTEWIKLGSNAAHEMQTYMSRQDRPTTDFNRALLLRDMFRGREATLLVSLATRLTATATHQNPKEAFMNVWLKEEAAAIAECALAFGHRIVIEQFYLKLRAFEKHSIIDDLYRLFDIYAIGCVKTELSWFFVNSYVDQSTIEHFQSFFDARIKEILPRSLDLVHYFDVPHILLNQSPMGGSMDCFFPLKENPISVDSNQCNVLQRRSRL